MQSALHWCRAAAKRFAEVFGGDRKNSTRHTRHELFDLPTFNTFWICFRYLLMFFFFRHFYVFFFFALLSKVCAFAFWDQLDALHPLHRVCTDWTRPERVFTLYSRYILRRKCNRIACNLHLISWILIICGCFVLLLVSPIFIPFAVHFSRRLYVGNDLSASPDKCLQLWAIFPIHIFCECLCKLYLLLLLLTRNRCISQCASVGNV